MSEIDDRRSALRAAVDGADGAAAVAGLSTESLEDSLQLAGDGLVIALAQEVDGAADLARRCVEALRERGWVGDYALAERLEAALGLGPVPLLRPLPVDLDLLIAVLEGDPSHTARIDLKTGDIWPEEGIDLAREAGQDGDADDDDSDRWLVVWSEGSGEAYRDMAAFIGTIADDGLADRLAVAISGRGPFRRFKDVLAGRPDELERWAAFADERRRGRARAWLAAAGYTPGPRAR